MVVSKGYDCSEKQREAELEKDTEKQTDSEVKKRRERREKRKKDIKMHRNAVLEHLSDTRMLWPDCGRLASTTTGT